MKNMKKFRVYFTSANTFEEESMVVEAKDSQDAINKFQVEIGWNYSKIGKVVDVEWNGELSRMPV